MSAGQNIGDREREILTAIVETFISTGEPVGSRMLSRGSREGLSPATIRNVMADLVDSGYLEQPHTSAGRVPSPAAYRYYVEQLSGKTQISKTDAGIIQDSLQGVTDVQEFMERTSHVLSLISRNVGVAVAASGPKNALEHVYFSRLGDQKVLAVVTGALEGERREKRIGSALEAAPEVYIPDLAPFAGVDPAEVFRTSQASLVAGEAPAEGFALLNEHADKIWTLFIGIAAGYMVVVFAISVVFRLIERTWRYA